MMLEEKKQKRERSHVTMERFIETVNNVEMKSVSDVAVALNLKPASVKSRIVTIRKDFGFKLRNLPMNVGTAAKRIKGNPERLEALRALAEKTYPSDQN